MREEVKIRLLQSLLEQVTKKYDYFILQKEKIYNLTYEKAVKDELTGLYNRFYLKDFILRLLRKHKRIPSIEGYLVFIDLDNFKKVNDYFGHEEGDRVLKEFAKLLQAHLRDYDILSRFGGDEFLVFIEGKNFKPERLELLRKDLEERMRKYGISFSFGAAPLSAIPQDLWKNEEKALSYLINLADIRMYEQKRRRKRERELSPF